MMMKREWKCVFYLLALLGFIYIIYKIIIFTFLISSCSCCNADIYNFELPDSSYAILFHVINWCSHPLLISGEFKRGFSSFSCDCYSLRLFALNFEMFLCYRPWEMSEHKRIFTADVLLVDQISNTFVNWWLTTSHSWLSFQSFFIYIKHLVESIIYNVEV